MEMPIWIQTLSILAIIASPLLAVWLTDRRAKQSEKRKDKLAILNTLMMTRVSRSCVPYVNAMNTIEIIFYDSKKIRKIHRELIDAYYQQPADHKVIENKNLRLIEEIAKELGYGEHINWEQISVPYAPVWLMNEQEGQEKFKQGQLQIVDFINKLSGGDNSNQGGGTP